MKYFKVLFLYGKGTKVIDWESDLIPRIGETIAINENFYKVYDIQYKLGEEYRMFELKISANIL